MKKSAFVLVILLLSFNVQGQFEVYLDQKNLYSVLLEDDWLFQIHSIDHSSLSRSYKALIKDARAHDLRRIQLYYDQYRKIAQFEAIVYDTNGNEIERFKKHDLEDLGILSGLATDGRIKSLQLESYEFPFIVKVSYKIEHNASLHFPDWIPQSEEGMEILSTKFTVMDFSGNKVRFHSRTLKDPSIKNTDQGTEYVWEIDRLKPYYFEKWNGDITDYTHKLILAPTKFKMDDYEGDMTTWESLGRWQWNLNSDRGDLSGLKLDSLDTKILKEGSKIGKTMAVYDYLQKNSRYVSIQLGIGGWQPFSSKFVHENKYGDCKALSNYTISLLDRYGIESYYTLIRAGAHEDDFSSDFPARYFNHAIVTVPIEQDTIFLECTSQVKPFGFLGTFTSDRNALIVTRDGGKLIRTKKYNSEENIQSTTYLVKVEANVNRNLEVDMRRTFEGLEVENDWMYTRYYEDEKANKKWFIDNTDFGAIGLKTFSLDQIDEGEIPRAGFIASFIKENGLRKAGSKLLLDQSLFFNSYLKRIKKDSTTLPISVKYGYDQADTLQIELPIDYAISKNSKDISFTSAYGSYSRTFLKVDSKTLIIRRFVLNDGKYPPDQFAEYKKFVNRVISSDKKKIVIEKKT